jgi:fibronectin type 3 domain-containing protein
MSRGRPEQETVMKKTFCSFMLVGSLALVTTAGCGGGSFSSTATAAPPANGAWVHVSSLSTTDVSTVIRGTAWISDNFVALHCSGMACLYDTSVDNYPGVDVTYENMTTGYLGKATSYYGGGTDWEHLWKAQVPVVVGNNTIRISATDPGGRSASVTVSVVVVPDTDAPSTPKELTAVPRSETEISLTWNASTDNNSVAGYRVYRAGGMLTSATGTSFVDTGLEQDTAYCYTVAAYDRTGNESMQSNEACATTMSEQQIVDSAADGACYNSSMTIDSADKVHLAYVNRMDTAIYELRHATNAFGAWIIDNVDTSWGYPSIATDSSNHVHIATHFKYLSNVSGAWTTALYDARGVIPSIAVDGSGKAHISYLTETDDPVSQGTTRRILYGTNMSGVWTSETLFETFNIPYSALALDRSASPYVAVVDYTTLYVLFKVDGVWSGVYLYGGLPISGSCWLMPSIVADGSGRVHVVAGNVYATNASGRWTTEIYDASGDCPGMAVDRSLRPHLVYKAYDAATGNYWLMHAVRGAAGWKSERISHTPQPGQYLSIAIDSSGAGHFSFCNGGDIVYLRRTTM